MTSKLSFHSSFTNFSLPIIHFISLCSSVYRTHRFITSVTSSNSFSLLSVFLISVSEVTVIIMFVIRLPTRSFPIYFVAGLFIRASAVIDYYCDTRHNWFSNKMEPKTRRLEDGRENWWMVPSLCLTIERRVNF